MAEHHSSASLPPSDYQRPLRRSKDGLAVSVVGEDGTDLGIYDFSDVAAPHGLLLPLVDAFETATGSAGRWRSKGSARQGAKVLRRFAAKAVEFQPDIESIDELSAETWWAWRQFVSERNRWPGQINVSRALLRDTEGLPSLTRRALNGRAQKPKARKYEAYSRSEFRRIRAAGWRVVHRTARRITTNVQHLEEYWAGHEPDDAPGVGSGAAWRSRGDLLDEISTTGALVRTSTDPEVRRKLVNVLGLPSEGHAAHALFPTTAEISWLMVTIVCEQGYNPSVLASLKADLRRADDGRDDATIYSADLDKPRRGPTKRYFSSTFVGDAARLLETAAAITQPARDTMAGLGSPTEQLLIARATNGSAEAGNGQFKVDWSWGFNPNRICEVASDDGEPLHITFQRLRLTDQVVNQRSRQNSDEVSESIYQRPDPQTRQRAAEVVVQGQQDALRHASETVQMRTVGWNQPNGTVTADLVSQQIGVDVATASSLLAGELDTATAACLDFTNSPFATEPGQPCPASFFACFACTNGRATPAHLPRLVALREAMERIGSAVSRDVWESDYAVHFQRLSDLLDMNATQAELDDARKRITQADVDTVDRLLRRGWDL